MTPMEETSLYKRAKEQVRIALDLDNPNRLAKIRTDVIYGRVHEFPMDDIGDYVAMEHHVNELAEAAVWDILEQCGITREDYQSLMLCNDFVGGDYYDCIPAYRGRWMGSCDSGNEKSSGVVGEE